MQHAIGQTKGWRAPFAHRRHNKKEERTQTYLLLGTPGPAKSVKKVNAIGVTPVKVE